MDGRQAARRNTLLSPTLHFVGNIYQHTSNGLANAWEPEDVKWRVGSMDQPSQPVFSCTEPSTFHGFIQTNINQPHYRSNCPQVNRENAACGQNVAVSCSSRAVFTFTLS
eukprot:scpid28141/ scgid27375/ 